MTAGHEVTEDYAHVGLTLRQHPVSFLRPQLQGDRVLSCADANAYPERRRMKVAGLVLVRQRPGSAKGVMFITIEDETGVSNLVIWPSVYEKNRRTIHSAHMLLVDARVQREGQVVHLVVEALTDLSADLAGISEDKVPFPLPHGRGDEFHHGGGSPDSRDRPIRPRPDQIAELTRGMFLPLPSVDTAHLLIIAERLTQAFNDIRANQPLTVSSGSEAEINALMEARLNQLIDEDLVWSQLVLCVARGKESLTYDGSHLEKRPDLSIYLTNKFRAFPLVAEAKIIDRPSSKTEALYCDKGLIRFVNGEYAWANREAFMLAYVRDRASISGQLIPHLSKKLEAQKFLVEALPTAISMAGNDMATSAHGRTFAYKHQIAPNDVPGPIAVWHVWLS